MNDAEGNPVPKFEAMLHTYHEGYLRWQAGKDGKFHFGADDTQSLSIRDDNKFQVIVRAPGMAPAFLKSEYRGGIMERTMTLTPGQLIELSGRPALYRSLGSHIFLARLYNTHLYPEHKRPF